MHCAIEEHHRCCALPEASMGLHATNSNADLNIETRDINEQSYDVDCNPFADGCGTEIACNQGRKVGEYKIRADVTILQHTQCFHGAASQGAVQLGHLRLQTKWMIRRLFAYQRKDGSRAVARTVS
jgi:hypothetical protein